MSNDTDFQAKPEEFIMDNLIIPRGGRYEDDDHRKIVTGRFTLEDCSYEPGGLADRVLRLTAVSRETLIIAPTAGFGAYWVAYEDNKAKRAVLGNAANFMFTATMTGCSFGIGTRTGTGDVLVSHANAKTVGKDQEEATGSLIEGRKAQADEQRRMLGKKMEGGAPRTVIEPYHYGDPDFDGEGPVMRQLATVIGLRRHNQWRFYIQKYEVTRDGLFIMKTVSRAG